MKKKSIIIICTVALAALTVVVAGKDMWFGGFHFGPPEVGPLPSEASWVKVDATINEDSYSPGEDIVIELTFQNNSTDTFPIEPFPPKIMVMPSLKYGLIIREFPEGEEVKSLESGETVSYILTWDQRDKNGQQVPAGDYKLALGNIDAWNQRFMLTLDKPAEITIAPPAEKTSETSDIIETIRIFKAQPPDNPPPPGGWTFQATGPYPATVQRLFDPGDKIFLGLVISEDVEDEVTFSRVTFFNRNTSTEQEIAVPPDDLGPFEPGWKGLLGFLNPWEVPDEDGEYELRLYTGDELTASARFNVGVWPASWGPEMVRRPAPIYEVRVITGQEEPRVDVAVYIKGGLPQGCEASHWYSVEEIIDDTIYIEVGIRHLKDVPCKDYVYFEETVNLWPSLLKNFTPGETYKVDVNGHITTFVMP